MIDAGAYCRRRPVYDRKGTTMASTNNADQWFGIATRSKRSCELGSLVGRVIFWATRHNAR